MIVIDVNFMLVVGLAVAAAMGLGYLWYLPQAFGKEWMKLAHVTKAAVTKGSEKKILTTAFAYFALAISLFTVLTTEGTKTLEGGIMTGIWLGCGISGMSLLIPYLWEGRPIRLFLISAGHILVTIILMCAIMAHLLGSYAIR